jgi:hypothetical protein
VGESSAPEVQRAADRFSAWLNRATVRYRDAHRLALLTFTAGPGYRWAAARGSSILIPRFHSSAKADLEMIAFADALVVVGDPVPWSRLLRYARDAGIAVSYYPGTP